MKITKKSGLALLLIGLGVLLLAGKFGFSPGGLFKLIFPAALAMLGYIGIRNGRTFVGWTLLIIGLAVLLGHFAGLIGLLLAVGLIVYGISILKKGGTPT